MSVANDSFWHQSFTWDLFGWTPERLWTEKLFLLCYSVWDLGFADATLLCWKMNQTLTTPPTPLVNIFTIFRRIWFKMLNINKNLLRNKSLHSASIDRRLLSLSTLLALESQNNDLYWQPQFLMVAEPPYCDFERNVATGGNTWICFYSGL